MSESTGPNTLEMIRCGGDSIQDCEAGYLRPCDCDLGCSWHIGPKKETGE